MTDVLPSDSIMIAASSSRPDVPPHASEPEADLDQLAQLVSHELRQPAQAIRSFVSILLHERAGPLNAIQRDFLLTAEHALRRLERLIADCEVTLSQSRALELVAQPIDLLEHVYGCVREVQPLAEANGLEVTVAAPAGGSFTCFADPDRIEQVLMNLLENACHYATPGSTIDIRLRRTRRSALCVIENDVDDATTDVAAWGEPFQRGAQAHTLHPKGRGLGLAVVHRLVSAHGGRVLARGGAQTVKIGFVIPNQLSHTD